MRRFTIFALIAVMLFSAGMLSLAAATKGDVNADGTVNITDILLVRDFIFGKEPTEDEKWAADVNDDGKINIQDILLIRDIIFDPPGGFTIITGEEAAELFSSDESAVIIDVRTQEEYDAGHVGGAILIPHTELADRLAELPDKNAVIMVYCGAGARSKTAAEILVGAGYTKVYSFEKVSNWPGALVISGEKALEMSAAEGGATIIDVRAEAEYAAEHVLGAILIPHTEIADRLAELPDNDAVIIVYCGAGARSKTAGEVLFKAGYKKVYSFEKLSNWPGALVIPGETASTMYDAAKPQGAVILDVRTEEEYAADHIEDAVLIPHTELAGRLAELPNKDATIIVYCGAGARSKTAAEILVANGYAKVYSIEKISNWPGTRIISGETAKKLYEETEGAILLDVRDQSEFDSEHIDGAMLISAANLAERLAELPDKDVVIIVYCGSGLRSKTACATLVANGYTKVFSFEKMSNWPKPELV